MYSTLAEKVLSHAATVAVIGQGYVGLPLALTIVRAGYVTYGIDTNSQKVRRLASGTSYVCDVSSEELRDALDSGRYFPTTDFSVLSESDIVVICVPTPLRKTKDPDISYIVSAVDEIAQRLHSQQLIILESTTYPGTTDELLAQRVESRGFKVGEDVFVCFSPERVDPGNTMYDTSNTPKVIGGITLSCGKMGALFYGEVMNRVVQVSSARVAEMAKLLENTFRAVNIALVNELALMAERMEIDIWEVIDAASTKPFGFMPFYPGPGIGGHCIPLDPVYLSWKAKTYDFYGRFIDLASEINGNMPRHVVSRVGEALNLHGKPIKGSRILVLGMAYKKDINDVRESPGLEVYRLLVRQGARVDYHDPHVPELRFGETTVCSVCLDPHVLNTYDCVVLVTDHSAVDYQQVARHSKLIVDTRNAFKGIEGTHIIRLGAPLPSVLMPNNNVHNMTKE